MAIKSGSGSKSGGEACSTRERECPRLYLNSINALGNHKMLDRPKMEKGSKLGCTLWKKAEHASSMSCRYVLSGICVMSV